MNKAGSVVALVLLLGNVAAFGRGVSPYLPLNLEPEIERQIERALILADKPVMTRPIAAATVLDALPTVCRIDLVLCRQVRLFLDRYMRSSGVMYASAEGAVTGGTERPIPNRHGMSTESDWQVATSLFFQPSDYAIVSLGGIAYQGETIPTGSMLSVGFDRMQLDIGYRGHWLSPLLDSSMLLGTEAQTMPSITLSNYQPLTRLGLRYEAFVARMSRSDSIAFQNGFTSGHPKIAGLHLSIEPVSGWALGVNRLMQYGGGARGGNSIGDVLEAFFRPSRFDNVGPDLSVDEQFGNQVASFTSRFLFPGPTPFALYFEYAGEDTSRGRDYLLGNSALSAGIHFPRLWRRFDLAFETSEWQNGWYVHHVYQDGLTNEGRVIGHWAGDSRLAGDAVGGRSHMLRLGWEPRFGGAFEFRYRTISNEEYSGVDYERGHDVTLRYSRPWSQFVVGAEVHAGRDVFGEDFSRAALFIRFGDGEADRETHGFVDIGSSSPVDFEGAELFVDFGVNVHEVRIDLDDTIPRRTTDAEAAPHFAIGVRRPVSRHSDIGARIELDDIDGHLLVGVRALDYRYRFRSPLALGAFLGAARYDLATPAYGLYGGVGAQWRDLVPGWDLGVEVRYASKVARDDLLPTDPLGGRNDSFYDIASATLTVSRRF